MFCHFIKWTRLQNFSEMRCVYKTVKQMISDSGSIMSVIACVWSPPICRWQWRHWRCFNRHTEPRLDDMERHVQTGNIQACGGAGESARRLDSHETVTTSGCVQAVNAQHGPPGQVVRVRLKCLCRLVTRTRDVTHGAPPCRFSFHPARTRITITGEWKADVIKIV